MKINILSNIINTPSGGGNQFLKALQSELIDNGLYEVDSTKADVILFNSFNFIEDKMFFELLKLKKMGKVLIHRIDGPISMYRGRDIELDNIIYDINNQISDATIFQSYWSREANYELGMNKKKINTVIMNAPDSKIFNNNDKIDFSRDRKIRLVATSWSSNVNKGFDVYKWMDDNLDHSMYEMTFIGNSPVEFKNIKHIAPLESAELSKILKNSDIYVTASKKDPCSNSLIEALHSGLPCLVLDDGGHPEIVKDAGEVFKEKIDIPALLEKIVDNYEEYKSSIKVKKLDEISREYVEFCRSDLNQKSNVSILKSMFILFKYYMWRIKRKFI